MSKRTHIILFNPDEMRWDTMGHMENPAAFTPFLDNFAKQESVSFRNAYCQNPVCVPSRCSLFTGLYPHTHGHRTMNFLLHPGEDNLFSELRNAGYYVWMNARNDLFAGQIEGWAESNADKIFYGGDAPKAPGLVEDPVSKAKHKYSHYKGKLKLDATGQNYNSDDEAVDAAVEFVKNYDHKQPLCLFLGLSLPHVPYAVEDPYYSMINRNKLPKRIQPNECKGKSKMLSLLRKYQNLDNYTEEDWNELRAVYFGMCTKIDNQFRCLCTGLKEAGIYDDCLILFFSDHGDFAGDYGITEKAQSSFEDCLIRVPLLIKPPSKDELDAGVTDSMAELVDIYATAMDYAGASPKRTHFGKSLRGMIADRKKENRNYVHCEGGRLAEEIHCDEYHSNGSDGPDIQFAYWPKLKAQTDANAHAKAFMIRSKDYKYISRITGEDEFYDLKKDPQEMVNQIRDPVHETVIAAMRVEMLRWLQYTVDVVPYAYDNRYTDQMLWAKIKNICPRGYESDIKEKIRCGIKLGMLYGYIEKLWEDIEKKNRKGTSYANL